MQVNLKPGDSLQAVMSGAATTTNPKAHVEWSDGGPPESNWTSLSGATAVDLLSCPTAPVAVRSVRGLSIYNEDTAAVTVTLTHVVGGTSYKLAKVTLQVGDTVTIDAQGVRVTDANGNTKNTQGTTQVVNHTLDLTQARVWDALQTTAPGTAANDDLAIITGTFLTDAPVLQTSDAKAATVTQKTRIAFEVPETYVAGEAITLRINAGMTTTVSGTTATVDAQVVRQAAPDTDICATAAQSINSLTAASKDFTITPTNVVPGDVLDIVLTVAIVDGATATAVLGTVNSVSLRPTVRV